MLILQVSLFLDFLKLEMVTNKIHAIILTFTKKYFLRANLSKHPRDHEHKTFSLPHSLQNIN